MGALQTAGRVTKFTTKYATATIAMLTIAAVQVPAVIWYVVAATPACDGTRTESQLLLAQIGLGGVGVASAALAVVLGARFLQLRWGWSLWWFVVAAALGAPSAACYLLPRLSPGTGGLFCH